MSGKPKHAVKAAAQSSVLKPVVLMALVALAVEVFVFNFPFFESLTYQHEDCSWSVGPGLVANDDGTYAIEDESSAYVEISGLAGKAKNLFVGLGAKGDAGFLGAGETYTATVTTINAEGDTTFTCPSVTISTNLEVTKYINLDTIDNAYRVYLSGSSPVSISSVGVNVTRPLVFSWPRYLLMLCVGLLVLLFRGRSRVYQEKLDLGERHQRVAVAAVLLVGILAVGASAFVTNQARHFEEGAVWDSSLMHVKDENQYDHLADAFIEGHLYLDLPVSPILTQMDNPYDTSVRTALNAQAHDPIYWDYAYYQGRYYCYFGALPALVLYVPYKLVTGTDLPTHYAVIVLAVLVLLGLLYLLRQVQKAYFHKVSLGGFLLGMVAATVICCVFEQTMLPRIYSVPMLASLALTGFGLGLWISVASSDFTTHSSRLRLLGGALCIALNLGCRPVFFLAILLAFPIFHDAIFKRRLFFSKKGAVNTLCVVLPCLFVGGVVMWYNYSRFGSPLDFGATYNLTGGDMTSRGTSIHRVATGLFEYVFQPLNLHPVFPFVTTVNAYIAAEGYQGPVSSEPFYGGMLALMPVAIMAIHAVKKRGEATVAGGNRRLAGWLLALALIVMMVDIQVSGITQRYFSDFGLFVAIPAVMGMWQFAADGTIVADAHRRNTILFALVMAGIILYGWTFLGVERFDAILYTRPGLFYGLKSWFIAFT